jgi:hypothetical protein
VKSLDNEIVCVFGRKGSGKTTWVRRAIAGQRRVLVLDSLGTDYGGGCVVTTHTDLVGYIDRVKRGDFCTICRPRSEWVAQTVLSVGRRLHDCWIVVDEADRYCRPGHINLDLKWIVEYGRHRSLSLIAVSRRPAAIHLSITEAADAIVCHQVTGHRSLEYLSAYMEVGELPGLQPFEWRMAGRTCLLDLSRGREPARVSGEPE